MSQTYLTLVSSTGPEPLSIREALHHLNDAPDEDRLLIQGYVKAAREWCERLVPGRRQFITATYDLKCGDFPSCPDETIELPLPPLQSITSVTYTNSTGGTSTFSSTAYIVHAPSEMPGEIELKPNQSWPATQARKYPATVRFVCGYGQAHQVPETVKQAMRLALTDFYENRGDGQGKLEPSDRTQKRISDLMGSLHFGNYR